MISIGPHSRSDSNPSLYVPVVISCTCSVSHSDESWNLFSLEDKDHSGDQQENFGAAIVAGAIRRQSLRHRVRAPCSCSARSVAFRSGWSCLTTSGRECRILSCHVELYGISLRRCFQFAISQSTSGTDLYRIRLCRWLPTVWCLPTSRAT